MDSSDSDYVEMLEDELIEDFINDDYPYSFYFHSDTSSGSADNSASSSAVRSPETRVAKRKKKSEINETFSPNLELIPVQETQKSKALVMARADKEQIIKWKEIKEEELKLKEKSSRWRFFSRTDPK